MLQAQSRHLTNTPSTIPPQHQLKYVVTTTKSTLERVHHHHHVHPSTAVMPSSQPKLTLMTSGPQLLPVPVARNSFRIDDILGEERTRRDDVSRRPLSATATARVREVCTSLTPSLHQTLRQSSDTETTERPPSDDINQLLRQHHRQQHIQHQLQRRGSSEVDNVDAVEFRRRSSSPVATQHSDSTSAVSFLHHHDTSGRPSGGGPPPSPQDHPVRPTEFDVDVVRPVPLRQSGSDRNGQLSPSTLIANVTAASHSSYLTSHRHSHPYPQQQQQPGQLVDSFASHHPVLAIPPPLTPISPVSLDPFHAFVACRHGAFLSGCEFSCFMH